MMSVAPEWQPYLHQARLDWKAQPRGIRVDISTQHLELYVNQQLESRFSISTAKNGPGNRQNSMQTPLGLHCIGEKIGAGAKSGTIFRGRQSIGRGFNAEEARSADDLITSRILRLEGLQQGFNLGGEVDSFERLIYIHGTAQEHLLGQAVSHGCIRMANADVIELFERLESGDPVLIDVE